MDYNTYLNLNPGDRIRIHHFDGKTTRATVVSEQEWVEEARKETDRAGHVVWGDTDEVVSGQIPFKLDKKSRCGEYYYQSKYERVELISKCEILDTVIPCDKYCKDETQKHVGEKVVIIGKGNGTLICKCEDDTILAFAEEEISTIKEDGKVKKILEKLWKKGK
jgi:hypothetical protein